MERKHRDKPAYTICLTVAEIKMTARRVFTLLMLCALICTPCGGQNGAPTAGLREWLFGVADRQLDSRREQVARIHTRAEAEARAAWTRKALLGFLGGLPDKRTPLHFRRTGTIDRGDYRIDNVIYESLPNFFVTANLYVPKTGRGPYPAVLQPVGHSLAAKSRAFYQTLALGLVKNGFVVLTYDPLGQGERRIFYDRGLGDSKVGSSTVEHQMVGIQSLLAGESVARYMVWDAIRSIDVLASLPEVDAARLGVAGCSGGGTITAYLGALDARLKVAAPACYISAWEEQLSGTGPQDAEQQFPDQLADGLDHADFITAFAPKPYLVVSTTEDFFPISGARRAVAEGRRIYTLFDAPEKIDHAIGPGGHGMPIQVREAIYGWMNRWLKNGSPGPITEPAFQTEFEDDLQCTPSGQVSISLGGETASTLNISRFGQKLPNRPALRSAADLEALRGRIRDEIKRLTRYEPPGGTIDVTTGASSRREGYVLQPLTYAAAGGRRVNAMLAKPAELRNPPVLFVADTGSAAIFKPGADADTFARAGHPVLAIDMAGFGPTAGKWTSYSDSWFGPDKLAWLALMVGKPLPGLGVEDILRGLDLLDREGLNGVVGIAHGTSGIALLHAAALDTRLAAVVLQGMPASYHDVAASPVNRQVLTAVVPGVLGRYDLPDLAACVAPRSLALLDTRLPASGRAMLPDVRRDWAYAFDAYAAAGAPKGLSIGLRREGESIVLPK